MPNRQRLLKALGINQIMSENYSKSIRRENDEKAYDSEE
jgi:hypothetical protein